MKPEIEVQLRYTVKEAREVAKLLRGLAVEEIVDWEDEDDRRLDLIATTIEASLPPEEPKGFGAVVKVGERPYIRMWARGASSHCWRDRTGAMYSWEDLQSYRPRGQITVLFPGVYS